MMNPKSPQKLVRQPTSGSSTGDIRDMTKPSTNHPNSSYVPRKQVMKEGECCSTCGASEHRSNFCPKKSSTTDATLSLANTLIPSKASEPQENFQRVWPRPATHFPLRYPGGSVFREELDRDKRRRSFFPREPLMRMRRMPDITRGISDQKDTQSCMTSLTSPSTCLPTSAQAAGSPPPAKSQMEADVMKSLPQPPAGDFRQSHESPRRPQPATFRDVKYISLSSLGQEDPYRDIQRRAKGVRLSHVPGGLADEYFFPQGTRSHTATTRRVPPPRPARSPPTQIEISNNESAPERRMRPLPCLPPPRSRSLPYPTHQDSLLHSEHHWIPTLPALPAPAYCADAPRERHTPPGPGIKVWTEKGPLVVECGVRPAKVLEKVERLSVVLWEELGDWEDTEEAEKLGKGMEKGVEKRLGVDEPTSL